MKRLRVYRDSIEHNIARVRQMTGGTVWGVLKGDGYGMGLLYMAGVLRDAGIHTLAVSETEDIIRLRAGGFADADILCLRSTAIREEAETLVRMGAIATVGSAAAAGVLSDAAEVHRCRVRVHIKIDTGMGRYGFLPGETAAIARVCRDMPQLRVEGIYTHFSCPADVRETGRQAARFYDAVQELRRMGIDPGMTHACSSAALLRYGDMGMDAVRVGSALVGCSAYRDADLRRAGELVCPITEVRMLPAGWRVGYGGQYRTDEAMCVAVVPLGIGDGLGRAAMPHGMGRYAFWRAWLAEGWHRRGMQPVMARVEGQNLTVIGRIGSGHVILAAGDAEVAPGMEAVFRVDPLQVNGALPREYCGGHTFSRQM